jgi:uncharacterized protein YwqG
MSKSHRRTYNTLPDDLRAEFAQIVAVIEEEAREASNLVIADQHPGLWESRLGGRPGWPAGMPYPTDGDGKPLVFFAQINCTDTDVAGFPDRGIIQFFVGSDALMGCEFPSVSRDGHHPGFRVVFHSDKEVLVHAPEYYARHAPSSFTAPFRRSNWMDESYTLLPRPISICPTTCVEGDALADKLKARFPEDEDPAVFIDYYAAPEAHLGGYPAFVSSDFREDEEFSRFDVVLLSLGSPERLTSFGDSGRVNFLINSEALKTGDFREIAYHWGGS